MYLSVDQLITKFNKNYKKHASIYENLELNIFDRIIFFHETFNN